MKFVLIFLIFCISSANQRQVVSKGVAPSSFSCDNRVPGYYADVETNCRTYHFCDERNNRYSYACPNDTLFQQRMLICDHWFMVDCEKSERDFHRNSLIGQKDKPFVTQEEGLQYARERVPVNPKNSAVIFNQQTLKFIEPQKPEAGSTKLNPNKPEIVNQQAFQFTEPQKPESEAINLKRTIVNQRVPEFIEPQKPEAGSTKLNPKKPAIVNEQAFQFTEPQKPETTSIKLRPDDKPTINNRAAKFTEPEIPESPSIKLKINDNRQLFFIPNDSSASQPGNSNEYLIVINNRDDSSPSMRFKKNPAIKGTCPSYCHPKFFVPGTCHPCVMIK